MEENKIFFIIPGEPQETVDYETYIKEIFVISYPDFILLEGPLKIQITAWLMIPKSTSKKKAKLMIERIIRPTKKPDWENVAKSVCDALEKLAYKNNSQIVTGIIHKFYSIRPRLEIEIYGAQI